MANQWGTTGDIASQFRKRFGEGAYQVALMSDLGSFEMLRYLRDGRINHNQFLANVRDYNTKEWARGTNRFMDINGNRIETSWLDEQGLAIAPPAQQQQAPTVDTMEQLNAIYQEQLGRNAGEGDAGWLGLSAEDIVSGLQTFPEWQQYNTPVTTMPVDPVEVEYPAGNGGTAQPPTAPPENLYLSMLGMLGSQTPPVNAAPPVAPPQSVAPPTNAAPTVNVAPPTNAAPPVNVAPPVNAAPPPSTDAQYGGRTSNTPFLDAYNRIRNELQSREGSVTRGLFGV